ncbi:hypothetical protein, partial [uncultured Oscillibacter sp.]|uniref:hypothetical protein n=1 Tax=uncultured Oscillibacter sp. TaxID=876091 RepID=UPI0026093CD0
SLGAAETTKAAQGLQFIPTPPKAKHTFPFSRLINLWIFDKMGAAQVSCCVGGHLSCIRA